MVNMESLGVILEEQGDANLCHQPQGIGFPHFFNGLFPNLRITFLNQFSTFETQFNNLPVAGQLKGNTRVISS